MLFVFLPVFRYIFTRMESSSYFEFNPLKLPKICHVFEYVTSRTSIALGKSRKYTHEKAVAEMAQKVHDIWLSADCPPKSIKTIKKLYAKLVLQRKKIKKKHARRTFEEKVWNILSDNVEGQVFDEEFFKEQITSWKTQMEKTVNPLFTKAVADKEKAKEAREKRKKAQYFNLEQASMLEVDRAVHQVIE